MTVLRNFTPHAELVYTPDGGPPLTLPHQGTARCAERLIPDGCFPGTDLPLTRMRYGSATGLPEPREGVVFVVSQLVVNACPERTDLAFPAGLVRDDAGTVIGFRHLARPADHD